MICYRHDSDQVRSSPPADPREGLRTSTATHGSASALANEAGEAAKNFIFVRGRLIVLFFFFFKTCRMQRSIKWKVILNMQAVFILTGVLWSLAAWLITCPLPCIVWRVWWWFPEESALISSVFPHGFHIEVQWLARRSWVQVQGWDLSEWSLYVRSRLELEALSCSQVCMWQRIVVCLHTSLRWTGGLSRVSPYPYLPALMTPMTLTDE